MPNYDGGGMKQAGGRSMKYHKQELIDRNELLEALEDFTDSLDLNQTGGLSVYLGVLKVVYAQKEVRQNDDQH